MRSPQPRRSALVIDDVPAASRYIRRVLERRHGVEHVFEAHTAAEALLAFEQLRTDLVTLDLVLPDEHGSVLLRRLRQVRADVPVVVISADQDPLVEEALRSQGARAVLAKPLSLAALDAAVEEALATPRAKLPAPPEISDCLSPDDAPLVLVVEDDPTTGALLLAAVRRAGCRAGPAATSLAQASQQVGHLRPALLLLGVTLPDGDGLDWLERLPCDERPQTIVVSAHCEARCLTAARRLGLAGYLLKPVSVPDVVARIATALGRTGTRVATSV